MKIGVDVCCWPNKRGFGRFTRELLMAMTALDQENKYLFFVDKETERTSKFPAGVNVITAPTLVSPAKAASASGRRSFNDLWTMSRVAMKSDFDIFFFPAIHTYFPIFNRTRIVVTIHDIIATLNPELCFPNKKLALFWKLKQYIAIRQADLILTVSEHSRKQIISYYKIPESRVRAISEAPGNVFKVLPQGDKMNKVLKCYQLLPEKKFILYVGGISPHKNLAGLIDAYAELSRQAEFSDIRLVVVGDYEGDFFYTNHSFLKKKIRDLGLQNKVIFTGFVKDEDLAYFYNAASLLVLPSFQEGFGLPVIEAMACGTPIAASNKGSLPEVLGDVGLFFDPNSLSSILKIIKTALSDDVLRTKMKEKGLERVKQFSWQKAAIDTLSVFKELVKT